MYYSEELRNRVAAVTRTFRASALVFGLVLFVAALVTTSNAVSVSISEHRDEITIMELSGATPTFIKGTYILEGIFQGFLGSILALLLLTFSYFSFFKRLFSGAAFFLNFLKISFLSPFGILALLLLGLAIGWIGSVLALRKFIR